MKIIQTPAPMLLNKAKKVDKVTSEIHTIIREMKKTLRASHIGIGLAAPQVGISLQIFVASPNLQNSKDKSRAPIDVFINPTIISQSEPLMSKKDKTLEGCLSIPYIWGPVARSKSLKLSYMDEHGTYKTATFTGPIAIIIQHEVDHLQGTLFTHRVIEQSSKLYRQDRKTGELEPIEL